MAENFDEMTSNLKSALADMKEYRIKLSAEVSRCDLTVAEYYHLFEMGKFPASVSSKLLKQFRECLNERRLIKKQLAQLNSLNDGIKAKGISIRIQDNKTFGGVAYTPKYLAEEFKEYEKYLDFKVVV